MSATNNSGGYSAVVRMQLCVNGHTHSIGHLGPGFIILDKPTDYPPTDGEIAVWIDGREQRWDVHLPHGIQAEEPQTRITNK